MCKFFSAVSDGLGNIKHFTPADIAEFMAKGNPKDYNPNSHTSIMSFYDIGPKEEPGYNKWEYNVEKKILIEDQINTINDKEKVKLAIEAYLNGKDLGFLRNLYGQNTGHRNTGHQNTGHQNTGHRNTGHRNTGHQNTGDHNTGDRNTGHQNTGDHNTGDHNTGHQNTGDHNTGHRNTGHRNTGHQNTGDHNTGDHNTGDHNTGHFNTTEPKARLFNKDTGKTFDEINSFLPYFIFDISPTAWTSFYEMTDEEKIAYPKAYVCDGYLKKISYKDAWAEAWKKASEGDKKKIKSLPNFDASIFEEITGVKV